MQGRSAETAGGRLFRAESDAESAAAQSDSLIDLRSSSRRRSLPRQTRQGASEARAARQEYSQRGGRRAGSAPAVVFLLILLLILALLLAILLTIVLAVVAAVILALVAAATVIVAG